MTGGGLAGAYGGGKEGKEMDITTYFRNALERARAERTLTATFHSLVLIHADELEDQEPLSFCLKVGLTEAYQIEFKKMISAARMLRTLGYRISKSER